VGQNQESAVDGGEENFSGVLNGLAGGSILANYRSWQTTDLGKLPAGPKVWLNQKGTGQVRVGLVQCWMPLARVCSC